MRRLAATAIAAVAALAAAASAPASSSSSVAALQVALRAQGHYQAPVDGIRGPLTVAALRAFKRSSGVQERALGASTRRALGQLGAPLLGQRELAAGAVGWDVSSLEFRLVGHGLPARAVDGRFTEETTAALRRFQRASGLIPDGIAGVQTFRALARPAPARPPAPAPVHVVQPGEGFFSIASRRAVVASALARANGLTLQSLLHPGQRLRLPRVAPATPGAGPAPGEVRAAIDSWASSYGVDPKLARALAWMESGYQMDVVSKAGAVGVMQLLPETWLWVDANLIGAPTPRTLEGNVQAGVRYLRWQLDQFRGDRRLALAGYYQGARAVRERGLFDDTKQYVDVILQLYGTV